MYFAYEYVRTMNMIGHDERTCSETPDITTSADMLLKHIDYPCISPFNQTRENTSCSCMPNVSPKSLTFFFFVYNLHNSKP